MLYEYNGRMITETELNDAVRLCRAFESGEIQAVGNINDMVAQAIMAGKHTEAVRYIMMNGNCSRKAARDYLMEYGEKLCEDYLRRKNETEMSA